MRLRRCLSLWREFFYRAWFREAFSFFSGTLFYIFFHFHLSDGVRFQDSQVLVLLPLSKRSNWFLILQLYYFHSFPLFIMSIAHISMTNFIPIFWLYILIVCIRVSSYFSFFVDTFLSSIHIRWLIFFLWFCKFVASCTLTKDVNE